MGRKKKLNSYIPNKLRENQLCEFCGQRLAMNFPIWIGNLYDKEFVLKMIEELKNQKSIEIATTKKI